MITKSRVRRRIVLAIFSAILLGPTAFFACRWETSNFETLQPGKIYRSGQMTAGTLAKTIRGRRIKTVLNLRGINVAEAWYRAERAAAIGSGAALVDISMSSSQWMSRAQLKMLVRVLDRCEYPLMIHCQWGAERTGLVSAFAELLRPGATLGDAKAQFSLYYMYVRLKDGKIMAEHLDQYEAWLNQHRWGHSPQRFRAWIEDGFVPRTPGRDEWPYDPYPLVVITRPEGRKATLFQDSATAVSTPIALKKESQTDARPR